MESENGGAGTQGDENGHYAPENRPGEKGIDDEHDPAPRGRDLEGDYSQVGLVEFRVLVDREVLHVPR